MIEERRIAAVAVPSRGVDLERTQRLQPRPLGFEPAGEPRPFTEQRLVRNLDRATVGFALANHETPLVEAYQKFLLLVVKTCPGQALPRPAGSKSASSGWATLRGTLKRLFRKEMASNQRERRARLAKNERPISGSRFELAVYQRGADGLYFGSELV